MKPAYLLACAPLLALAPSEKATAATDPISQGLRQAICQQDWQRAVTLSSRLMASATISPEYRQQLVTWRYRFSQYAAGGTRFAQIPNCEGVAPALAQSGPTSARPDERPDEPPKAATADRVEMTKAALRQAICRQDWGAAVQSSSRLMASDSISAAHRQQLVTWRHRFADYAASQARFDAIPNCEGVVTAAPVTPVARVAVDPDNYPSSLPLHGTDAPRVTAPRSVPSPTASCYVTYSSGQTVALEQLCQGRS